MKTTTELKAFSKLRVDCVTNPCNSILYIDFSSVEHGKKCRLILEFCEWYYHVKDREPLDAGVPGFLATLQELKGCQLTDLAWFLHFEANDESPKLMLNIRFSNSSHFRVYRHDDDAAQDLECSINLVRILFDEGLGMEFLENGRILFTDGS